MNDRFIDKEAVMEALQIRTSTLYKHIRAGIIKKYKIGGKTMFSEKELKKLVTYIKQKGHMPAPQI